MDVRGVIRRHPLAVYFSLAYSFSVLALVVIGLPDLSGKSPVPSSSFVMFPVLVVGVGASGLALTALGGGSEGIRQLGRKMSRWRVGVWAWVLLVPPAGISLVLLAFRVFVSSTFAQQPTAGFALFGLGIGLVAGFFEEIGWTGFAYPRMSSRFGALGGALLLGVLWGIWHFPVADSLGAASPHGPYFPEFFAGFVAAMIAMRVLIAWLYTNTGSVLVAQLMHACSTASLVALSAPHVSPAQEATWYAAYAVLLWVIVAFVVARFGVGLARRRSADEVPGTAALPNLAG